MYTAVYTVRNGPYAAVYTARSRPCTQAYVYTAVTRPCTRHIHGRVHGQHTVAYTCRVHGRVHGPLCTWHVGLPGRVHVHRRHATAVCGPLRPCTRPVHSPFTAVYTAVYVLHGPPTRAYVYTAVKRPCTRHVHVRVHGQYTVVYMAGRPTRPCTRAETTRYGSGPCTITAIGRVQGRNAPCTRSCTRPIHSRVHVRLHGPCTRPHTRTVWRNGPHTAVACRLVTCTRPGRPTCRTHGPDGPCTRPCNGRVHGPLHGRVRFM